MGIAVSQVNAVNYDDLANSWFIYLDSLTPGDLVVIAGTFQDAGDYFSSMIVSGMSGATWQALDSQGFSSNLGWVGAVSTIVPPGITTASLTVTTAGGQNYDATSIVAVKFSPTAGEVIAYNQRLGFNSLNRGSADTLALQALGALAPPNNIVVGFAGSTNTGPESLTFSATSGWSIGGQTHGPAGGGLARRIGVAIYYAVNTSDTTVDLSVAAASDRLFGGSAEYRFTTGGKFPKIMPMVQV